MQDSDCTKQINLLRLSITKHFASYYQLSLKEAQKNLPDILLSIEALAKKLLHSCDAPESEVFLEASMILNTTFYRLDINILNTHLDRINNSVTASPTERKRAIEGLLCLIHLLQGK